jgi:SynChlorMet cassette radical SAM/SPASM protein ScmF
MNNKEEKEIEKKVYPLNQIYFYLTEGCNLACRHCWLSPKHQRGGITHPVLPFDLFQSITDQAKSLGVPGIKLTGGEPLLHPQIHEILKLIQTQGFNLVVETNGVLCSPDIAQEIAACKNTFVSISLDGADMQTHEWVRRVNGCFEAALEGIRNLTNEGLKPQIIMSIMRRNKDQVEKVVRLAEYLGAGSVKFNLVQPTGRGEKMNKDGDTLSVDELIDLGEWVETKLSASTDLKLYYHKPPAFRPLSRMYGKDGDGSVRCGVLGIIGVLADGSFALCGIGSHIPELVFGQASKSRLEDVWNNNPVLLSLREGIPYRFEGICGDCVMKKFCMGSCIAQNFYRGKNLWTPYWFCEEANNRGLFPKTRIVPIVTHKKVMQESMP